jgi:hypothetical protein
MTEENFAAAPVSIGEHRSITEQDCSLWTPREMLVKLLRDIDTGAWNPEGIVLSYFYKDGEGTRTGMWRAKVTVMQAVACVEMAKHDLLGIE